MFRKGVHVTSGGNMSFINGIIEIVKLLHIQILSVQQVVLFNPLSFHEVNKRLRLYLPMYQLIINYHLTWLNNLISITARKPLDNTGFIEGCNIQNVVNIQ